MPEFSRELYSFVEIARERSIRRAADRLNIASSALSRQIRLLEADMGTRLIERRVTGIELTEAGRQLLEQAREWIEDSNRLRTGFRAPGQDLARTLRIGTMECFAGNLMPDVISHLHSSGLADRVEIRVGGTDTLLGMLQEDHLDIVVAFNVHVSQAIRVVAEQTCRLGLVISPRLFDPAASDIPLSRALDWPICLPDESLSSHVRLQAEILKQHAAPDIRATSNSIACIRALCLHAECASFLSWLDVREEVQAGRLRFIPLADRRLSERICITVSGERPYSATKAKLAKMLSAQIARLASPDA